MGESDVRTAVGGSVETAAPGNAARTGANTPLMSGGAMLDIVKSRGKVGVEERSVGDKEQDGRERRASPGQYMVEAFQAKAR
jgi:hypothetical protein